MQVCQNPLTYDRPVTDTMTLLSQAIMRAVMSAATIYDRITADTVWEKLGPDHKKYLKDQVDPHTAYRFICPENRYPARVICIACQAHQQDRNVSVSHLSEWRR